MKFNFKPKLPISKKKNYIENFFISKNSSISSSSKNPIELGQKIADQLIGEGASELLKEIRRQIAL
jgi:hypothetical protein